MQIKFSDRLTILFLLLALSFNLKVTFAQCYSFTNYSLKQGLPQSQVFSIFQATDRTLWLGTFGGISNFDGKEFTSYSKADGLLSNSIHCISEDENNQIIVGTELGLNIIKDRKIISLMTGQMISSLEKDNRGVIWGLASGKLFKLIKNKVFFEEFENDKINNLFKDQSGHLYCIVNGEGIFKKDNEVWIKYLAFNEELSKQYVTKVIFDKHDPSKIYLLTYANGIFLYKENTFTPFFNVPKVRLYTLAQDGYGNIWIGSEKGAYLINSKKERLYFNALNGLSDNAVHEIFNDAENNIWVSSYADGIYKYEGDAFIKYSKFKGEDYSYAVSAIGSDKNDNLFIGTFGKGLWKYDGKNVSTVQHPAFKNKDIFFINTDKAKNLWFSVRGNGIWKYNGAEFTRVINAPKMNFTGLVHDLTGGLWVIDPTSCIYLKGNEKKVLTGFKGYNSCLLFYKKDSVFVGTSVGLMLIKNGKVDPDFKIAALDGVYILGMIKHNDNLVLATLGDGLITWNPNTKAIKKYTINNGLNSNDIYSLAIDKKDNLWLGTGRGINTLSFNKKNKQYTAINHNSLIVECNQNAILPFKTSILIGTIEGLISCATNKITDKIKLPVVSINKVNVFNKKDKAKDKVLYISSKRQYYKFEYYQNHISINYKGVFLTDPHDVTYRYMLSGLDVGFGKALKNTQVEYSSLEPGKYIFLVYAIANGRSSKVSKFEFEIIPPFYGTIWFKVLAFFFVAFLFWLIFYLIFKSKARKQFELEEIKKQEKSKIRKQTAEDFHDDIGNKLTRISVLSEILDQKTETNFVEQKELIKLIKDNAALLYSGTKDILWALNPKSDNLFEVLLHIKNFGIDLFQHTGISFKMEGASDTYQNIQLSMEFNRNISLIFKELLNNILKHAQAKNVVITVVKTEQNTIEILTIDDGIGYDEKKIINGHGINNIHIRCKRIKCGFKISSFPNNGTVSCISTKIIAK